MEILRSASVWIAQPLRGESGTIHLVNALLPPALITATAPHITPCAGFELPAHHGNCFQENAESLCRQQRIHQHSCQGTRLCPVGSAHDVPKCVTSKERWITCLQRSRAGGRVLPGEGRLRLYSVPATSELHYVKPNSSSGTRHRAYAVLGAHHSWRRAAAEGDFLLDMF